MAIDEYTGDALAKIDDLIDATGMDRDEVVVGFANTGNGRYVQTSVGGRAVTENDVMELSDGEPSEDGLNSTVSPALADAFNAVASLDASYDFSQCEGMPGASDIRVAFSFPDFAIDDGSLDDVQSVLIDGNIGIDHLAVVIYDEDGYPFSFDWGEKVDDRAIEGMYDLDWPELEGWTVDSLRDAVQEAVNLETAYAPLGYRVYLGPFEVSF